MLVAIRTISKIIPSLTHLSRPNIYRPFQFYMPTFSNQKQEEPIATINISEQELQQIRNIINNQNHILQGQNNNKGEQFFQNEQAKLSFKVMQMESVQQLKGLIRQYGGKQVKASSQGKEEQSREELASLIRCKFIIVYKYINLNGKITNKEIQPLYADICNHIDILEEIYVCKFYRIIANQIKLNPHQHLQLPPFPRITNPTNNNSELLSLLIMLYPNTHPSALQHYQLHSTTPKQIEQSQYQPQRQMLYDPVHLIHIMKHLPSYRDHYQSLFRRSMASINVQESTLQMEESVRSEEALSVRQFQAAIFCLHNKMYLECNEFYLNEISHLSNLPLMNKIALLKQLLMSKKELQVIFWDEKWMQLIMNDIRKKENRMQLNEQEQIEENTNFKNVVEILTIIYLQHPQYLQHPSLQELVTHLFTPSYHWQISVQSFNIQELLNMLVCYKAYYDYFRKERKVEWVAEENEMIVKLFECFREELHVRGGVVMDGKSLLFWCWFGVDLGLIDMLKIRKVYDGLRQYRNIKDVNNKLKEMIDKILTTHFSQFK